MKRILILILALMLVGAGCITAPDKATSSTPESVPAKTPDKAPEKKFSFDIDISKLSYDLPSHTKVCTPDKKQACSSEGCEDIQPTVFLVYNENNNMIYRCDNKPCDGYEVKTSQSGLYTNIEPLEPRGFSIKISNDNKYVEAVSLGLDTLVSYGTCR